ncbi:MAG: transcription antitermination factor NusB [Acidimicrobiia bacterium]
MKRTEAREEVLGVLYAADSRKLEAVDITKISKRASELAEGIWDDREAIDELISHASAKWRIERMPVVDRNILRIGVYELENTDLSIAIVISQAVELAKKFSTARSGSFINGILSAVAARDEGSPPGDNPEL